MTAIMARSKSKSSIYTDPNPQKTTGMSDPCDTCTVQSFVLVYSYHPTMHFCCFWATLYPRGRGYIRRLSIRTINKIKRLQFRLAEIQCVPNADPLPGDKIRNNRNITQATPACYYGSSTSIWRLHFDWAGESWDCDPLNMFTYQCISSSGRIANHWGTFLRDVQRTTSPASHSGARKSDGNLASAG